MFIDESKWPWSDAFRGLADKFTFTAGSELQLDDLAILSPPASNATQLVSNAALQRQATSLKHYRIHKLPVLLRNAPRSRALLPEAVIEALRHQSLSTVIAAAGLFHAGGSQLRPIDGEDVCWSLMDHVLAYPYHHPDGYVPGTAEFQDWRLSMSKQYAVLLLQQHAMKIQIAAVTEDSLGKSKIDDEFQSRIKTDEKGSEEPGRVPSNVLELKNEYRAMGEKLRDFHHEQRLLQRHYLRLVKACTGTEDQAGKVCDRLDEMPRSKYTSSSLVLVPLLACGQKRVAIESATRPSVCRKQDGHVFSRAQKKQRKTCHYVAADDVSDKQPGPTVVSAFGEVERKDCEATYDDWVLLEVERDGSEAQEEDEVTLVNMDTSSSASIDSKVISKYPIIKPGAMTTLMELPNNRKVGVEDMRDTSANRVDLSQHFDVLKEIESLLTGLKWDFEEMKALCCHIDVVLCVGDAVAAPTCEEIANFIPDEGARFIDVVDQFVDRVPDTIAGVKILREMIDEAGSVDESMYMVRRREALEFIKFLYN